MTRVVHVMPKVIHQSRADLGERKAIEGFALEFYDDGTAQLTVTVWVPISNEADQTMWRKISAGVVITAAQRQSLVEALKGPLDARRQQEETSSNAQSEGVRVLDASPAKSGHVEPGGGDKT